MHALGDQVSRQTKQERPEEERHARYTWVAQDAASLTSMQAIPSLACSAQGIGNRRLVDTAKACRDAQKKETDIRTIGEECLGFGRSCLPNRWTPPRRGQRI